MMGDGEEFLLVGVGSVSISSKDNTHMFPYHGKQEIIIQYLPRQDEL